MTTGATRSGTLQAAQVSELIQALVKALRAFQMYLPNNPIYQRAIQNVQAGFHPVWLGTDELRLTVSESDLLWGEEVVYTHPTRSESFAWGLHKDGLRELVLKPGVEETEVATLLGTINRARYLPTDAGDDLLTLLWEQEYHHIEYRFTEFGEGDADFGMTVSGGSNDDALNASPDERQAQVRDEAPPRPKGMIDVEDFDSTLYFLDETEIGYITQEMEAEYNRDVRTLALHAIFDIYEAEPDAPVREEILVILDTLFPNLLNKGEFKTVAGVLRELRGLAERAPLLRPVEKKRLEEFEAQLSAPAITKQLVQALDEGAGATAEGDVTDVLKELRASALETLVAAIPDIQTAEVKALLEKTADRIATNYPAEVVRLLQSPGSPALEGVVKAAGRLQLPAAIPGLADVIGNPDPALRAAAVQSLIAIGTPGALTHIERAVDDSDRNVRLAAVRALGARGYKGALKKVEAVVMGSGIDDLDLTERMAFFEAYGGMAGPQGVEVLSGVLLPRGLFRAKLSPDTRACAAMALGKMRTAEARAVLQRCADDKELVVRNAVNRALRGQAT